MTEQGTGERLNAALVEAGLEPLDEQATAKFAMYVSLILRWSARLNLTSARTEDAIISRHLAESIACAMALPLGVATLLDYGSGAGFPGIPIAICRPEIAVILAESQGKKAAFLQEAARVLGNSSKVCAARAETLRTAFDFVVLRAVDRMPEAVAAAAKLVAPAGFLAVMTTDVDLPGLQAAAGVEFSWNVPMRLPFASQRIVAFGTRRPVAIAG